MRESTSQLCLGVPEYLPLLDRTSSDATFLRFLVPFWRWSEFGRRANMSTAITALTQRVAWKTLEAHHHKVRELHLRKLFADDPGRGQRMTVEDVGFYLLEEPSNLARCWWPNALCPSLRVRPSLTSIMIVRQTTWSGAIDTSRGYNHDTLV